MSKFYLEKVLHELVRDLPEIKKANDLLENGLITSEYAFYLVSAAILKERDNA